MTVRMTNPAKVLPDAMTGIQNIYKAIYSGGVPQATLELVHLRASQVNGCGACVHAGVTSAAKAGESAERLHALAAATSNCFNRINTTIKEPAGATWA